MNERKRKVADIALKLFIDKGFQDTSIQEIIDKADISKGTFYNYFSSKNDCIAEILENIRYDASQQRVAIQVGKDDKDRDVLIEQITTIMKLNEENRLRTLFENILSSDQADLKKLVMQHRVIEMEWMANRLVDVMGEEIREYATEATILYFGMLQYMLFTLNITNSQFSLHDLIETLLSYVEILILQMEKSGKTILNRFNIDFLKTSVHKKLMTQTELIDLAHQLHSHYAFQDDQQDLFDVIVYELERDPIRKVVVQNLLKPFLSSFEGKPGKAQAQLFTNAVWTYLKAN
ncbi:TetR/AcrR family transcriptional regulator [Gracilibacillus alcaliphilus]|uniref:TetR/AcrR family transcriptional regulator n=1 Tax=Gracilibacillus alcaliphilus TaxID=1401441 RepID=UPI00195A677E|nr:TetR/AcrR family transcriptional regulator [Gracilibacillus alcaliphilus]